MSLAIIASYSYRVSIGSQKYKNEMQGIMYMCVVQSAYEGYMLTL